MGNRAVISIDTDAGAPCIYLHWNGGRASVEAFLQAARELGLASESETLTRAEQTVLMDALAELLAKHFFHVEVGFTVYRELYGRADTNNHDNGTYIISPALQITRRLYATRKHTYGQSEEYDDAKTAAIFEQIRQSAYYLAPFFAARTKSTTHQTETN